MNQTKDCARAQALFDAAVDNTWDESERTFFESHLKECETCRAEYGQYEQTVAAIRDTAPDIPADLHTSILKHLEKKKRRSAVILNRIRIAGGVCAAALLCVAILKAPFTIMGNQSKAREDALYSNIEPEMPEKVDGCDGIINKSESYMTTPSPEASGTEDIFRIIYNIADTDLVIIPDDDQYASVFEKKNDGSLRLLRTVQYILTQDRLEIRTTDAYAVLSVKDTALTLTEGDLSGILTDEN